MYPSFKYYALAESHRCNHAVGMSLANRDSRTSIHFPGRFHKAIKGGVDGSPYEPTYDDLSILQKRALLQQTEDIRLFNKTHNWFSVMVQQSQTAALCLSLARLFFRLLLLSCAWPWTIFIQSHSSFYHTLYFSVVYVGLFVASVLYLICHLLYVFNPLTYIYGTVFDWSFAKWLNTRIFESQDKIVHSAKLVFGSAPVGYDSSPDQLELFENTNPRLEKRFNFNVDVAKSILLMCAVVYERDRDLVKDALAFSRKPQEILLRLLKSEELAHQLAHRWGLEFVSVADFGSLGGPFAGVFYQYQANDQEHNHPFAVLVTKATSFSILFELLTHAAANLESSTGLLPTSVTHSSFFNDILPGNASEGVITPYMRIIDTLKRIASTAKKETGKRTNLFIGGHALGAGIASYLYARLLAERADLGDDLVLRDAYTFGTVRDFDTYPIVTGSNLEKHFGPSRQSWSIVNRARSLHLGEQFSPFDPDRFGKFDSSVRELFGTKGSHIDLFRKEVHDDVVTGVRIELNPYASSPPFCDLPDGLKVAFHDANPHEPSHFSKKDNYGFGMQSIAWLFPILYDLVPQSYMFSLCKVGPQLIEISQGSGNQQGWRSRVEVPGSRYHEPQNYWFSEGLQGLSKAFEE